MTTAKLIINGKEIEVQLTDEQAQELTAPNRVTGFERANKDSRYFYATFLCQKDFCEEHNSDYENYLYETANYYTDESLAEWCIRNDTLNRKMRRWAAEHNTEPIDWTISNPKWFVEYSAFSGKLNINEAEFVIRPHTVYFNSFETAQAAIAEFGDEIKWLAQNRPKWF